MAGLRSFIEKTSGNPDEEVTLVVLVSCLLFVCFEMLQGDQKLVISHLIKGMKILFAQYKSSVSISATMRAVVLGNDFPDTMDSLADVFVRLDADSTMFGRRSTYLCTSCMCCCRGSEIDIQHSFSSVKMARSHLDLLTSATFRLRGDILTYTEQAISSPRKTETWTDALEDEDWAKRYCKLYAVSRTIDLTASASGTALVAKQVELITAFKAWQSGLSTLTDLSGDLSVTMLRIQHFFLRFVVSTLRDQTETACDRFHSAFAEVVGLASEYIERTRDVAALCGFALESGILRSLYIIGLKCRDFPLRRRAVELLRNATVQEGLWSGKTLAAYLQRVIDVEETQVRNLNSEITSETVLTYELVPEEARLRDVVLGSDDTRPLYGRVVCSLHGSEDGRTLTFMEDEFQLLRM